jgi:hypothetical protein
LADALSKACVFCGDPPDNKTREHVIPQWLIELTGDPKRTWNLGIRFDQVDPAKRERKFAADQFQFPACEACNNAYADLEGRAKGYVVRLIAAQPLTGREWSDLLDWFDKVRIGLWLGMRIFSKELLLPPAKFHIEQRIGRKDRFVLVYRINPDHKGLIMSGAGDLPFLMWPSWLTLTINNLIFVNVSSDYLLAARMGFPFPRTIEEIDGLTHATDFEAFFRIKTPLVRFSFHPAPIAVYQAILVTPLKVYSEEGDDQPIDDRYRTLSDNEFVREQLVPGSDKRSLIYSSDGVTTTVCQPDEHINERDLPKAQYRHGVDYLRRFFEYREHMMKQLITSGGGRDYASLVRGNIKFNRLAIETLDDQWEKTNLVKVKPKN